MGLAINRSTFSEDDYVVAAARLRENLQALKEVLQRPGFGIGQPSLGAEIEMCIVDDNAQALLVNTDILERSTDPLLVQELNRFNLEYNLSPVPAAGAPFAAMEAEFSPALAQVETLAAEHGGRIIAIGILPTLTRDQLSIDAMTDRPRYHALANGLRRIRGEDFHIQIDGDEPLDDVFPHLTTEGANTSFQLHLRVNPDEFAATYNAAQLATPLALALGCNSPFYLGHKLWSETRIALFKQAVDTRGAFNRQWRRAARVPFGHGWVRQGAYELFAESCLLYPILMPVIGDEHPLEVVAAGGVPSLAELRLQQGTIWNWNRAVYDAADGGHLRIEFRALPSGPTPIDMMANAAFIVGLTMGLRDHMDDLLPAFPFRYAEYNFYRAAQNGLDADLLWPDADGPSPSEAKAGELCRRLLPLADEGLASLGVDSAERKRLLGVIDARLTRKITPAAWQRRTLDRYADLPRDKGLAIMVKEYMAHASSGMPVSEWT
jgi:gamma-glutamyl:cysteine ligase YbdK (ATP-grasp superfamily)